MTTRRCWRDDLRADLRHGPKGGGSRLGEAIELDGDHPVPPQLFEPVTGVAITSADGAAAASSRPSAALDPASGRRHEGVERVAAR